MSVLVTNNAVGYLLVGVNDAETSILLKSGQGSRFPSPVLDQDWFYVTVQNEEGEVEVMKCTKRSGDTLTVQRGQDNTTSISFKADSLVELRPCAALFNDKVDYDYLQEQITALQTQISEFKTEINMKFTSLSSTTSSNINEFKELVEDTYLPLAGGALTGELTSSAGITITGAMQAGSFKITPEPEPEEPEEGEGGETEGGESSGDDSDNTDTGSDDTGQGES